jgi:homoserine kinase
MHKVKITLPATITNLGPGLGSLGLAVGLYTTIEISRREDENLVVETAGEGAGRYGTGLRHPVVLALMRIFQKQERAVLGMTVKINNHIPLDSGLGAEAAFWVAGVIGANNLLGAVYTRDRILEIAAAISHWPDQTVTTILGGLTSSIINLDILIHRSLPITALSVVIALPELENYMADISRVKPERVALNDALYDLSRLPLLLDGLRTGDLPLIGQVLDDRLQVPYLKSYISGYEHVAEMARRTGAQAVTLSGDGPAMIAFASDNHKKIASAMELAFENVGVKARSWVLPVDQQGVVISVVQSS